MRFLYSLLLTLVALLLLPWFILQGLVTRKYIGNFRQRLGFGLSWDGLTGSEGPTIWLHAVSVGETIAARPLLRALRARYPGGRLVLSTTTMTGQEIARTQVPEVDLVCYFPFDWSFSVRRVLDMARPDLVILMESELWLNFLSECRTRAIPVVVANGRISDRSFPRSLRFRFFVNRLYSLVSLFVMQTAVDGERAVALGASPERVIVGGNLKYDVGGGGSDADDPRVRGLDRLLALSSTPLIVVGSTHPGEEAIVLAAFRKLLESEPGHRVRLLIAPRHPERFEEVARLLSATGLPFVERSKLVEDDGKAGRATLILLDSIGELAALFSRATIVLIGGSLVERGGHNILEPASYSKPVIVGPNMENFREMSDLFLRSGALIKLNGATRDAMASQLEEIWESLLADPARALMIGERARATVEANRGATVRTVALIAALLEEQVRAR